MPKGQNDRHNFSRLGRERTRVYHRVRCFVQILSRITIIIKYTIDNRTLNELLAGLPLGPIRYFDQIGSTNVEAARWADQDAPDLALVAADEQTAGKGRRGRRWLTPPGAALAFSLVLRPPAADPVRLTALGALVVCEALQVHYGLVAQIKWPNDVLLQRRKTAGILAEATWQGNSLAAVILGIGINIAPESAPPDEAVAFPATSVESVLGRPVPRFELLRHVLESLLAWRSRLEEAAFIHAWDERLAFKGEWVNIFEDGAPAPRPGRLIGLDARGRLRLEDPSGAEFSLLSGEVRLRPN